MGLLFFLYLSAFKKAGNAASQLEFIQQIHGQFFCGRRSDGHYS